MPLSSVISNTYNPNSVATEEMRLLFTSIHEDGLTQPVVTIWDDDVQKYVVVDGFHRYSTVKAYQELHDSTHGHLPIVVLDKPMADRMASTVRHNRARGKHSVAGMGNLVFEMLRSGESDAEICRKIGVDAEELLRLKHITGYSKLFAEVPAYSQATTVMTQMKAKKAYRAEHPEEDQPVGT